MCLCVCVCVYVLGGGVGGSFLVFLGFLVFGGAGLILQKREKESKKQRRGYWMDGYGNFGGGEKGNDAKESRRMTPKGGKKKTKKQEAGFPELEVHGRNRCWDVLSWAELS